MDKIYVILYESDSNYVMGTQSPLHHRYFRDIQMAFNVITEGGFILEGDQYIRKTELVKGHTIIDRARIIQLDEAGD